MVWISLLIGGFTKASSAKLHSCAVLLQLSSTVMPYYFKYWSNATQLLCLAWSSTVQLWGSSPCKQYLIKSLSTCFSLSKLLYYITSLEETTSQRRAFIETNKLSKAFLQLTRCQLGKHEQNSCENWFVQDFANIYKFENSHLTWESHFMRVWSNILHKRKALSLFRKWVKTSRNFIKGYIYSILKIIEIFC